MIAGRFWLGSRESENPLKYRVHRELSEQIRLACEERLGIRLDPYWFSLGNVYPDCTHHRVLHHEIDAAGGMVGRMIRRFCRWGIGSDAEISRWRSLRLGIIAHYLCDFSCYVHTAVFDGTLREHRAYENAQLATACPRPAGRLAGAVAFADDGDALMQALRACFAGRDPAGYSPSGDLEYAADIACGAICEMLRLCREKKASLWWYHLPVIRRRHLAYA